MTALLLLAASFLGTLIASRRSLVAGIAAVCATGYAYGVIRANVPGLATHFLFDASVIALYLSQFVLARWNDRSPEAGRLGLWVGVLVLWPALLVLMPGQDLLVQLVGLRGNVFLVLFLLLGARLRSADLQKLAIVLGVLNLLAFAFAVVQFIFGVEPFFPPGPLTELIYRSNDVGPQGQLRIPSSFPSAHAFAATMLISLPLLAGAMTLEKRRAVQFLLSASILCSILAIFLASTRLYVVMLAGLTAYLFFSGKVFQRYRTRFLLMVGVVALVVFSQERMQRFVSVFDVGLVTERVGWSINRSFLDLAARYPLGNGLGAGGTSVPHFLEDRIRDRVIMENEYARIMLEQGMGGLLLWVAFIVWLMVRSRPKAGEPWELSRRMFRVLIGAQFAAGLIGIGLFTAIPQSALLFLFAGWIVMPQRALRTEGMRSQVRSGPRPLAGRVYG